MTGIQNYAGCQSFKGKGHLKIIDGKVVSAGKMLSVDEVVRCIEEEPEINDVHHIQIRKLDDDHIYLEAHLDFNNDVTLSVSNRVMERLKEKLQDIFDIEHTTFQCEYQRDDNKQIIV